MSYPTVTFKNFANIPVEIYDSFNDGDQAQSLANYFGKLTQVGPNLAANGTITDQPLHGPISVYIVYDTNNNPIKRVFTMGTGPSTFNITHADVDVITLTTKFIQFIKATPNDPLATSFNALIKDGKAKPSQIDAFFAATEKYKTCTFISYMLVMTTQARTPASKGKPIPQATYSLSSLLDSMGVSWPSSLPDIEVSNFSCTDNNDTLVLSCTIDINNITFGDGVLSNITSMLPGTSFNAKIIFNYTPGLTFLNTTLEIDLPKITIPAGNININNPKVILTIAPLFKFVVFEVKATIPFSLFSSPTFNADIAMTVDNVEAEVGVVLEGNNNTLLTPPVMKGVHFDSVGVGMGVIFEPPSFALGVQGAFHIGNAGTVALDDNNFVVVCSLVDDVPNPLYISFYVPKMNVGDIVTIFTNSSTSIDFPISVTDLSFTWAENPMEPVTLPDGSLAAMAYGFSGNLNFFGLDFYGDVEIDLTHGLTGNIAMSPFALGPLSLTGNGKGVSIKVDAQGNPIKNNFVPKTAAEKLAVQNATSKQLVAPGGPSMTISTSSSPYFNLGAGLKFWDFNNSIDATVASNGITFDLTMLTTRMHCTLKDYQNFSGSFSFGPDFTISLPSIAGFSLGSIHFQATINANLGISISSSKLSISVGGGFSLFGLSPSFGPFEVDVNITSIAQLFSAIEQWIINNAENLFGSLFADAKAWLNAINNKIIQPLENDVKYLAQGLATAFNTAINEASVLLKDAGYAIDQIAGALQTAYKAGSDAIASALQYAGYGANEISGALNSAGYDINQVASSLNNLGYGLQVVSGALYAAGYTVQGAAIALKYLGYGAQDVASALSSAFGAVPDVINTVLQQAGYAVDDIKNAFESLGGAFASFASSVWSSATHYLNPSNW